MWFVLGWMLLACREGEIPEFGVYSPERALVGDEQASLQGLTLLRVEATTFRMGSPETENGRQPHPESDQSVESSETPFVVTLTEDYYLSSTEVTRGLWFDYADDDQLGDANCLDDDCPIQFISWNMAVGFTNYLSQREGLVACYDCIGSGRDIQCTVKDQFQGEGIYRCAGFRLPTEAEWELAARAGSTSALWTPNGGGELPTGIPFDCGDHLLSDGTRLGDLAWFCGVTDQAQPVGLLEPNGFGFYDLHGNVWEWTHDRFDFYPLDATTNHVGMGYEEHTLRGGRWGNEPYAMRAAKRIQSESDFWDGNYGFRIAIRATSIDQQ